MSGVAARADLSALGILLPGDGRLGIALCAIHSAVVPGYTQAAGTDGFVGPGRTILLAYFESFAGISSECSRRGRG